MSNFSIIAWTINTVQSCIVKPLDCVVLCELWLSPIRHFLKRKQHGATQQMMSTIGRILPKTLPRWLRRRRFVPRSEVLEKRQKQYFHFLSCSSLFLSLVFFFFFLQEEHTFQNSSLLEKDVVFCYCSSTFSRSFHSNTESRNPEPLGGNHLSPRSRHSNRLQNVRHSHGNE